MHKEVEDLHKAGKDLNKAGNEGISDGKEEEVGSRDTTHLNIPIVIVQSRNHEYRYYWKCNFHGTPHVNRSVVQSVGLVGSSVIIT